MNKLIEMEIQIEDLQAKADAAGAEFELKLAEYRNYIGFMQTHPNYDMDLFDKLSKEKDELGAKSCECLDKLTLLIKEQTALMKSSSESDFNMYERYKRTHTNIV